MSKNLCKDCNYFNPISSLCVVKGGKVSTSASGCPINYIKPPTLFDRITASPEVLAEKFVIKQCNQFGGSSYKSILLIDENGNYRDFYSRDKALAATVEELKKVAK